MNNDKLLEKIVKLEQEVAELKSRKSIFKDFFNRSFSKINVAIGITITVLIASLILYAAQITFTDGTVISADEVNSNFTELYSVAWSKNGVNLYYDNGNVGIGTSSPNSNLEIKNYSGDSEIRITTTEFSNSPRFIFQRNDDNTQWDFRADGSYWFKGRSSDDGGSNFDDWLVVNKGSSYHAINFFGRTEVHLRSTNEYFGVNAGVGDTTRFRVRNDDNNIYAFGAWQTSWSDRRLKKDIKPLSNVLDKLNEIKPITYKWKKEANIDNNKHYGVIAQEIRNLFPELVYKDKENYLNVKRDEMQFILIQAIKELKYQNEILKSRVQALEKRKIF